MAAYPSYGILLSSARESESKWLDSVSDAGSLHSRQIRSAEYIRFELTHTMTTAQYRALMATYNAGERDTYTLTYYEESPAVTYSVKFTQAPQITRNLRNNLHNVKVQLRGTQD